MNLSDSLSFYLDRFDFPEMGRVLSSGILECVSNAIRVHNNEIFFGFALDCHVAYGAVHFSLGTVAFAERIAARHSVTLADALTSSTLQHEIWALGDWPLSCVEERLAPGFVTSWRPWELLIERVGYMEIFQRTEGADLSRVFDAHMLTFFAQVLTEASRNGAFSALPKTQQFQTIVLDHDEEIAAGLARCE